MARPTPSQQQREFIRRALLQAGYGALMDSEESARIGSLRPAIAHYLEFRGRESDTPLEELVTLMSQPRHCNRPDVDYTVDGEPMRQAQPPAAKTIERFLSGDIDPLAAGRGVTFWTHTPIRVRWSFNRLASIATDRNMRRWLRVWQNICGIRYGIVEQNQHTNIRIEEANLGPGILGMAQLPSRNMPEGSTLWNRMALGRNWNVELWNTTGWHELGHNNGSGHIRGGLMNPSHIPGLRKPQPQDIQWARQHYPGEGLAPDDTDLVSWLDTPTTPPPDPTPPPVPTPGDGKVWVATSCVIRESADGQVATMTGTFRRA